MSFYPVPFQYVDALIDRRDPRPAWLTSAMGRRPRKVRR